MEELLTIDEVSQILKLTKSTIYQFISTKKIPYVKLGSRSVRFCQSDIQAWLKEKCQSTERRAENKRQGEERRRNIVEISQNIKVNSLVERAKKEVLKKGRT